MTDYQFKSVSFNCRVVVKDPIAAAVRKKSPNRVSIRIHSNTALRCGFTDREMLTPFLDLKNRTILLLANQRPLPLSARAILKCEREAKSSSFVIEFPRSDGFDELFELSPMRGMILREASAGRLVFTVPKLKI